jgi:hypothetical protein
MTFDRRQLLLGAATSALAISFLKTGAKEVVPLIDGITRQVAAPAAVEWQAPWVAEGGQIVMRLQIRVSDECILSRHMNMTAGSAST